MSAQLATSNSFSAHLALAAGVSVSISAATLADLSSVVARVQGQPANDPGKVASATPAATPAPAPTQAPATGNAPASTATPVSAPAAAAGSAASGEAKNPTYDDVKAKVLALSKISRDKAMGVLGKFTGQNGQVVDHGNKLKLEDYASFIAAADAELGAAA